ncbi:S1C family serine protease [Butyrivibrio sp. AD3002]|uniref:S1C family serine protease n=1 Tax=Butyrivibrio sp. AD3002 TaxID=1280670 RepID=UPI0003B33AED|nr:trypsin-like peptidase domain-containing protein [Butyrivibrio sp. AD3002]
MFDNENNEQQNNQETGFGREAETNNAQSENTYSQGNNSYGQNQNTYGQGGNNTYGQGTYNRNNTYGNYTGSGNNGSGYGQNNNTYGNYNYNNQGTYGNYQYSYQPGMNGGNGPKKSGTGKKVAAAIAIALVLCLGLGAGYYSMTRISQIPAATEKDDQAKAEEKSIEKDNSETVAEPDVAAAKEETGSTDSVLGSGDNAGIAQTETVESSRTVVTDVTEVVAKAMPAMVSINNNFTQSYNYFGQTYSQEQTASGSGFIVGTNDTELLIATNFHVIEGADSLEVQFADDSKSAAEVKGTDSDMDLAVIAVQLSDLAADTRNAIAIAALGDSDSLTLGEPAIAIGNALGYGQSVTTGVVSAINRVIDLDDEKQGTFIQTNAEINPGNSGGALLNINGEVIGINSNKIGGSTVEGMGYAIPISIAKPIIEQLMTEKTRAKVDEENRGYLGISGVSVTSDVSEMYGLPLGVYVAAVSEDGGAKAAGVQEKDIITKFDGKEISSMDDLQNRLAYYEAGEVVTITVQRQASGGYQEQELQVTLGSKQTVQSDSDDTQGQKYDGEQQPDAKQEEGQEGQQGQQGIDPFSNPFGFGFDFGN